MPAPTLSWLHLSDLHIGLRDPGLDRRRLFEQMFDDLRALLDRTGLGPDLIVFTGDLTQHGTTAQFDEFDEMFWTPLRKLVGAQTQVLAIPGNHDLLRPRNDDETTARSEQILADPSQLWRSTDLQSLVSGCFTAYADWWSRQTQPANLRQGLFPGDFLVTIEVEGVRWGIAGLNTAVTHLASRLGTGSLWVNKAQLAPALDRGGDLSTWIDGHAATILLTHHPEEWLHEDASKDFRTGLCANDFDLHLFGHMHESFDDERRINSERERVRIQAPSLFGLRTRFFTKEGRPDVERRFGYVLTEAKLEAESLVRKTWPRAAYLQPTGRWVFGSDRSYTYEHDVLAAHARSPRNNRLLVPIKAVERRPRSTGGSWPRAVVEHRLWASACGVEVSRWRERSHEDVTTIVAQLRELERPGDPWRDADYVPRVLAWLEAAPRTIEISGRQIHALLVAPCLRELVELNSLTELERHEIDDWSPRQAAGGWRRAYESVLALHPRLVRRATGLEPTRRRCLSLWFARQAIDLVSFRVPISKLELDEYVYELARAVGRGSEFLRSEGGPAEGPDIVASDGRPLTRPMLASLLSWAGAAALDLRHVDSSLLEHVVADGYALDSLREALAAGRWSGQRPVDVFEYECDDAITHYGLTQLIETSARRAADVYMLDVFEPARSLLPAQLSARGVEPCLDGGRPRFQPHHVRFRLDNSRVRELLMGEGLYGSPELALRELYQNALDACRYRRARAIYLDRQQPYAEHRYQPKIDFVQGRTKTGRSFIECVDNGVGLDLPTLEHVFAVAGRRFHDRGAFVDERNAWLKQGIDFVPNSQHGIGVLSYFMLADEIEIETRAFRRDGRFGEGLRIRITSATGVFRIETLADDSNIDAGTRVRLYLHDGLDDALGARPRTSIIEALAKLLIVAEFPTSAIEYLGDPDAGGFATKSTIWKPGQPLAGAEVWPTGRPNIWWSDSEVPVLSDGIVTDHKHPCLLINLCGDQYPRLSADRTQIVGWSPAPFVASLHGGLGDLERWDRLSVDLLRKLTEQLPELEPDWRALIPRLDHVLDKHTRDRHQQREMPPEPTYIDVSRRGLVDITWFISSPISAHEAWTRSLLGKMSPEARVNPRHDNPPVMPGLNRLRPRFATANPSSLQLRHLGRLTRADLRWLEDCLGASYHLRAEFPIFDAVDVPLLQVAERPHQAWWNSWLPMPLSHLLSVARNHDRPLAELVDRLTAYARAIGFTPGFDLEAARAIEITELSPRELDLVERLGGYQAFRTIDSCAAAMVWGVSLDHALTELGALAAKLGQRFEVVIERPVPEACVREVARVALTLPAVWPEGRVPPHSLMRGEDPARDAASLVEFLDCIGQPDPALVRLARLDFADFAWLERLDLDEHRNNPYRYEAEVTLSAVDVGYAAIRTGESHELARGHLERLADALGWARHPSFASLDLTRAEFEAIVVNDQNPPWPWHTGHRELRFSELCGSFSIDTLAKRLALVRPILTMLGIQLDFDPDRVISLGERWPNISRWLFPVISEQPRPTDPEQMLQSRRSVEIGPDCFTMAWWLADNIGLELPPGLHPALDFVPGEPFAHASLTSGPLAELIEQLNTEPLAYPDIDHVAHVDLMWLTAMCHLRAGCRDETRALLLAGREWLWWCSDQELHALLAPLRPCLVAEHRYVRARKLGRQQWPSGISSEPDPLA